MLEILPRNQDTVLGISAVAQGMAPSANMSGSGMAMLQSQTLQRASVLQGNYYRYLEALGTGLLFMVRDRMTSEVQISLAGRDKRSLMTPIKFSGKSLRRIRGANVELGNPLQHDAGGRADMAMQLLQMGLVTTPEQYLSVLETGRLEPLTESPVAHLIYIRQENEQLADGELPPALITDNHELHCREHAAILASPEARRNPKVVQIVTQHIAEHMNLFYTAPPQLLALMGISPPQMPAPGQQGMPGGPQQPPGQPGSPPKPPGQPPSSKSQEMPRMPSNPMTGKQFDNQSGGGVVKPKR
jgi:hypothetical protein